MIYAIIFYCFLIFISILLLIFISIWQSKVIEQKKKLNNKIQELEDKLQKFNSFLKESNNYIEYHKENKK